ncbi:MAG: hypothetical protein K1000chlam4_00070 [Chlamydiae bacterium]|nr:hypothetical protein [Chlamydiota bacterium]
MERLGSCGAFNNGVDGILDAKHVVVTREFTEDESSILSTSNEPGKNSRLFYSK